MTRPSCLLVASLVMLGAVTSARAASADEGMWTFDNPPAKKLDEDHGFSPDQSWYDHVRLASVRFNNGGSGSFVSGKGLVMTNHHVGLDCIQKLSSETSDHVENGFIAWTMSEERRCPDLELNVLISMDDVTARIDKAISGVDLDQQAKARKEEMARIEKECSSETGLRCDVITLYGGGQYVLYRYRKHTDVRLVFAPEQQVAFFGGDHDNFTYPRHDLDVALFRVYEKDAPYEPEHYLAWSAAGPRENDLVLVSGNPGYSGRQLTVSQLEVLRDTVYPARIKVYGRLHQTAVAFALRGEEQERQATKIIFALENALKAYRGFLDGLQDEALMERKTADEKALIGEAAKGPDKGKSVKGAVKDIRKAQKLYAGLAQAQTLFVLRGSDLFEIAQHVVRLVEEKDKPNEKRLEEYRDSALESLELGLYSEAPIYPDLEEELIRTSLELAVETLGPADPFVKAALGSSTPAQVARDVAQGTRLVDPQVRRDLVKAGKEAIESSDDPMIRLALAVDPITRELRKRYEEEVQATEERAGGVMARTRFDVYGKDQPPDATFTLRLSYGVVKGYEAEGTLVPWKTTFYGMYDRYHSFGKSGPWSLPALWVEKKGGFKMATPLNFVCTADIIGGNSGSPVVNRVGEVVGLVFDGNIQSLVWRFAYTEKQGRAVAVHSSAIKRALYSIYDAGHIAWELGRKGPPSPKSGAKTGK